MLCYSYPHAHNDVSTRLECLIGVDQDSPVFGSAPRHEHNDICTRL